MSFSHSGLVWEHDDIDAEGGEGCKWIMNLKLIAWHLHLKRSMSFDAASSK